MVLSNLDKAVIAQRKLGRFIFSLLPIMEKNSSRLTFKQGIKKRF